jgi:signal transduction histidine kinase
MDISWLCKKVDTKDEIVDKKVKDIISVLNETVETVRRISSQLRPGLLDDIGLSAAIDWQLNEFEKRSNLKINFISSHNEILLSNKVKTAIYRIFQESLTNVSKHAEAKQLSVSLLDVGSNIVLSISDDGIGFSMEEESNKKTFGLLGIKERVSMIGGEYEIYSAPGKGTSIKVSVPLG